MAQSCRTAEPPTSPQGSGLSRLFGPESLRLWAPNKRYGASDPLSTVAHASLSSYTTEPHRPLGPGRGHACNPSIPKSGQPEKGSTDGPLCSGSRVSQNRPLLTTSLLSFHPPVFRSQRRACSSLGEPREPPSATQLLARLDASAEGPAHWGKAHPLRRAEKKKKEKHAKRRITRSLHEHAESS